MRRGGRLRLAGGRRGAAGRRAVARGRDAGFRGFASGGALAAAAAASVPPAGWAVAAAVFRRRGVDRRVVGRRGTVRLARGLVGRHGGREPLRHRRRRALSSGAQPVRRAPAGGTSAAPRTGCSRPRRKEKGEEKERRHPLAGPPVHDPVPSVTIHPRGLPHPREKDVRGDPRALPLRFLRDSVPRSDQDRRGPEADPDRGCRSFYHRPRSGGTNPAPRAAAGPPPPSPSPASGSRTPAGTPPPPLPGGGGNTPPRRTRPPPPGTRTTNRRWTASISARGEFPPRQPRLVGHDREEEPFRGQAPQRLRRAGQDADAGRVAEVSDLLDQRPVPVQEDDPLHCSPPVDRPAPHGPRLPARLEPHPLVGGLPDRLLQLLVAPPGDPGTSSSRGAPGSIGMARAEPEQVMELPRRIPEDERRVDRGRSSPARAGRSRSVVYAFRVKKSTRIPLCRSTFWSMRIPTRILFRRTFITSFAESALRMTVFPTHSLRSVTIRSRIALFNGRDDERERGDDDAVDVRQQLPVPEVAGHPHRRPASFPPSDSRTCSAPSIRKCSRMYAASIFGRWTNSAAEVPIRR